MATETTPLSDEERAELEALRAEKARREEVARANAERAELERLKAERAQNERERAEDQRIAEVRARNSKLMEPDEDLHMPLAQKIVLIGLAVVVIAFVVSTVLGL